MSYRNHLTPIPSNPNDKDRQSQLTQYYTEQLPHVDRSLLPQSQQTMKAGSNPVMIDTAGRQP